MANIDQVRASAAFKNVESVARDDRGAYDALVHSMPAMLRSAGLCQSLHFLASRKNNKGASLLLTHLQSHLAFLEPKKITSKETLLSFVRSASIVEVLALTREALAVTAWYRRAVQALDDTSAMKLRDGPAERGPAERS